MGRSELRYPGARLYGVIMENTVWIYRASDIGAKTRFCKAMDIFSLLIIASVRS
jgi:hypothetical protein